MGRSKKVPDDVAEVKKCLGHVVESKKLLSGLESKLKELIAATTKMLTSLDVVGNCLVNSTAAVVTQLGDPSCGAASYQPSAPVGTLHGATKMLSAMMHDWREGTALSEYKEALRKNIFDKIDPLHWSAKKLLDAGHEAHSLLVKCHEKEAAVARKVQKYAKVNKDIGASKRYTKQVADRDKAQRMAELKTSYFKSMYTTHMANVEESEGVFVDCFIDATFHLMQKLRDSLGSVGSSAIREYPDLASVLVRSTRHSTPPLVNDNSPATLSSRLKVNGDNGHVGGHYDSAEKPNYVTNLSDGGRAAESPYLINYADIDSSPSRLSDLRREPLTQLRPPTAQDAPNEPDTFEGGLSSTPTGTHEPHP